MVLAYQVTEPVEAKKFKIKKITLPDLKPNEVRVKNHFAAVNHFDVHHRNGQYPLTNYPQTLGVSGSGEIIKLGSAVRNYKVGDKVIYATNFIGSYAEEVNINANILFSPDKNTSLETLTAISLPCIFAHALLTNVYSVKKNNNVFVTGATGGVGNILVQMLNSLGVNVYGVVGSDEKIAQAKGFGCKYALNYKKESFLKEVLQVTGNKGAHVIYDAYGEKFYKNAIKILQPTGILVNYGDSTGVIQNMNALELWKKSLFFVKPHASVIRSYKLDRIVSNDYIYNALKDRKIIPKVEVINFKDIPKAHTRIENGEVIGNIVARF
ncbi:MAG: zinc-binding dehydrogenase [Alphaproteobacteria bacterium]|jgi:NADPH:quinone reductase|nr:zinc-binding dehydrogenase [Alphaproteobacteria bacterium]MBT5827644.1 zinc-binding dehydrogenase [Alphaproteobacteria bacterium]